MKYINRIFVVLMAVLGLASCDQDNIGAIYTPNVQNVSFGDAQYSALTSDESTSVKIRVVRSISAGAYTANLVLNTEDADVLSLANGGAVSFADGQSVAYTTVDAKNMKKGVTYAAKLALSDADVAQADTIIKKTVTECAVEITCDYNWVSAGSGSFFDGFYFEELADDVKVMHAEGSDLYRLVTPELQVWKASGLPAQYQPDAANFDFQLKSDGTVVIADGQYNLGTGYDLYFNTAKYGAYCNVTNVNGVITVNSLMAYGSSLYIGAPAFVFTWTNGYPLK